MRSWKLVLVVLFLAFEGMFVTNWMYTFGQILPNQQCLYTTCPGLVAYNCSGNAACIFIGTVRFQTCLPSNGYSCQNNSNYGSINCAGTCANDKKTPCMYTWNFCAP
jgi:hypothetical protein